MKFEISEFRSSTVWTLYRMRDRIQLDPEYQRLSGIWTTDKRQLLVDTILNDFDIPKIYFHKFKEPLRRHGQSYDYAIIDGKQRLETLWSFIDGDIPLPADFQYFKDLKVKAGNMTYAELGKAYPDLKAQFDSFTLSVITIDTEELEVIEEMFSRLNEAAPLTAPEKRNAFGGPMPLAIKKLAAGRFFRKSIPFPNKRFRHFDLATKFLLAEHEGKVVDTKKAYLDDFVESFKDQPRTPMPPFLGAARKNAEQMAKVFSAKDSLLRQVGLVTVYYHLFRIARGEKWLGEITRKRLADFEDLREANRLKAEKGITKAAYDLLEFDQYAQSPNDSYAIKFRLSILVRRVFRRRVDIDKI